jgi:FkbM family methyltransferase
MKQKLKCAIRQRFPSTVTAKSWWNAYTATKSPEKPSYSQTGEDKLVLDLIDSLGIESRTYVDVGANQPTKLNNTYLLYRRGYRGIVIEPNRKLLDLHRRFRPGDVHLGVGCGETTDVLAFRHATSHVLSGFDNDALKTNDFLSSEYMPVLPLDLILSKMEIKEIALLSIDVEGFDFQVAKGAVETLKKTRIVVIEGGDSDDEVIEWFATKGFMLKQRTLHNLVFLSDRTT